MVSVSPLVLRAGTCLAAALLLGCAREPVAATAEGSGPWRIYRGAADASAAVHLGRGIVVVADDEDNVLRLDRTGKNRSARPTQAKVTRRTVKNLRSLFPRAPRATSGKLAIVLDIDGIDDSPTLVNYEPSSLDYVRQVSIFKSSGGYSTVITTPSAICYQVRIPIWSRAATGNERKAEIYIDLKPR